MLHGDGATKKTRRACCIGRRIYTPAELRLHLDFLSALRNVLQLLDEHIIAVSEHANLDHGEAEVKVREGSWRNERFNRINGSIRDRGPAQF